MAIKTIIIEDEKPAARKLMRLLEAFDDIEVVGSITSVEEGVEYLSTHPQPDLILSDIVLGDGLSFDIFETVDCKSFIIYTTAFDTYTLRAFKLNSVDYLLKPISLEDLQAAIDKYRRFAPTDSHFNPSKLKQILKEDRPVLNRFTAKIGYQLKIIKTEDVSLFYSENKIVYALTSERSYPTDFTLDELIAELDSKIFFRTNRQTIINLNYIETIKTSPVYTVEMRHRPDEAISISRDRVKDFKDWLN